MYSWITWKSGINDVLTLLLYYITKVLELLINISFI